MAAESEKLDIEFGESNQPPQNNGVRSNVNHTSQNSFNKWTKISSHEVIIFELKNDGKKWSRIYFEIDRAPSEILAKLPVQFG